ncbi:hypothetical protein EDC04DRAFT_2610572 [Pisolithus marmoratus]|nr:hypothetical protein EDC04DRAFT_2610572 [Pisolithus marmoratus]
MKSVHRATTWAQEAQGHTIPILWNAWATLAGEGNGDKWLEGEEMRKGARQSKNIEKKAGNVPVQMMDTAANRSQLLIGSGSMHGWHMTWCMQKDWENIPHDGAMGV